MTQNPKRPRILILIVGPSADPGVESVLSLVPSPLWDKLQYETEILAIDDATGANASQAANPRRIDYKTARLRVLHNSGARGYGGNQKIGFHYAIRRAFDVVVLLQSGGQCRPETLPALIDPIVQGKTDVILGSRLLKKGEALRGGMPVHRLVGNWLVTRIQNWLLGTRFAELHSGYRVYSVKALDRVPFDSNSNAFDFDTDILIQLLDQLCRVHEYPIAAMAGTKTFRSQGLSYGIKVLLSTLLSRLQRFNLYYSPKFDYGMRPVLTSDPGLERLLADEGRESGGLQGRRQDFGVRS